MAWVPRGNHSFDVPGQLTATLLGTRCERMLLTSAHHSLCIVRSERLQAGARRLSSGHQGHELGPAKHCFLVARVRARGALARLTTRLTRSRQTVLHCYTMGKVIRVTAAYRKVAAAVAQIKRKSRHWEQRQAARRSKSDCPGHLHC